MIIIIKSTVTTTTTTIAMSIYSIIEFHLLLSISRKTKVAARKKAALPLL